MNHRRPGKLYMDSPKITLEILDNAYRDAMFGPESPEYMTLHCQECDRTFDFIKGVRGESCDHLARLFGTLNC